MTDSNLQVNLENKFMSIFRDTMTPFLSELASDSPVLLSEEAKADLEKPFRETLILIAGDTLEEAAVQILAADHPIVALDRKLCTNEQRHEAYQLLESQLKAGDRTLPAELYHVIRSRFRLLTDALSEMLRNITRSTNEISDLLFDGVPFTRIERIEAGAGDYHNKARATAIIRTDRGTMVYKPRNCLTDVRTRMFVEQYFPDSIVVPKCYTDGASFGVCEYLKKDPVNEDAEAAWFYALGELTVMAQILGSCDLHNENVIASGGLPALIDLETILSPLIRKEPPSASHKRPSFNDAISYSIWYSALLPKEQNGRQLSILMRTDDIPAAVIDYPDEYFAGIDTAYRRCLAKKEKLEQDVKDLFSDVPVRLMMRSTQIYADLLKRMYRAGVLSSEEALDSFSRDLEKAMKATLEEEMYSGICCSETEAILQGDIPYFYTFGNSTWVFDINGKISDAIRENAVSESLKRIRRMSEQDLLFEKKLIRESLEGVPVKKEQNSRSASPAYKEALPERSEEVLPAETAAREAGEILKKICSRMVAAPNGSCGWIDAGSRSGSPEIMQSGMFTGTAGIGVFAAAAAATAKSGDVLEAAGKVEKAAADSLADSLELMKEISRTRPSGFLNGSMGEASGMGGILRCMVLMNRYSGCSRYAGVIDEVLDLLTHTDISAVTDADRITGLSGTLSLLCSYPEFYQKQQVKALIAAIADRLLELRTFEADGFRLWKTVSARHLISGAGHGMAGIAESLYAAGRLLSDRRYTDAASDALEYEERSYSEKFRTWPDNRSWPAQHYMHGYCSGAPGIGIMMQRILENFSGSDKERPEYDRLYRSCTNCALLAKAANDKLPLLYRDHLCCGNSAIAESFLANGEPEKAGSVLNAMYLRKEKSGDYMTMSAGYHSMKPMISLFYGISGVGYEMLRYAFPDRILPLL